MILHSWFIIIIICHVSLCFNFIWACDYAMCMAQHTIFPPAWIAFTVSLVLLKIYSIVRAQDRLTFIPILTGAFLTGWYWRIYCTIITQIYY